MTSATVQQLDLPLEAAPDLSLRQVSLQWGFNTRMVRVLLDQGILTMRGKKVTRESLEGLLEGEHYVKCRGCNAALGQVTRNHLKSCCGLSLEEYREKYPDAPLWAEATKRRKAKTPEQKKAQSEKLKVRFQTPEGEVTRQQIAKASRRMQASESGVRSRAHLRNLNQDPTQREFLRQTTKARWGEGGDLREAVTGWHAEHREETLASAAYARSHLTHKKTKLHMGFKTRMDAFGLEGFISECQVGYYAIDEAHPEMKIAVEIDGCYWHGCAVCGFPGLPENRALDKRKNTYLRNRGWVVLRFPGHLVREDPQKCLQKIKEAVARRQE